MFSATWSIYPYISKFYLHTGAISRLPRCKYSNHEYDWNLLIPNHNNKYDKAWIVMHLISMGSCKKDVTPLRCVINGLRLSCTNPSDMTTKGMVFLACHENASPSPAPYCQSSQRPVMRAADILLLPSTSCWTSPIPLICSKMVVHSATRYTVLLPDVIWNANLVTQILFRTPNSS